MKYEDCWCGSVHRTGKKTVVVVHRTGKKTVVGVHRTGKKAVVDHR